MGVTLLANGLYDGAPVELLMDNEVVNTVNFASASNPFTGMVTVSFDGTFAVKAQSADRAGNLTQTETRSFLMMLQHLRWQVLVLALMLITTVSFHSVRITAYKACDNFRHCCL